VDVWNSFSFEEGNLSEALHFSWALSECFSTQIRKAFAILKQCYELTSDIAGVFFFKCVILLSILGHDNNNDNGKGSDQPLFHLFF